MRERKTKRKSSAIRSSCKANKERLENNDSIIFDHEHGDLMPLPLLELDRGYLIFASLKLRGYGAELVLSKRNACSR